MLQNVHIYSGLKRSQGVIFFMFFLFLKKKKNFNGRIIALLWNFHLFPCFLYVGILDSLLLLLLLLSCFSRVRLCAIPQMAAHQAPWSLGLSRQEHWSGLPLPSPMHESEKWKWKVKVTQSCVTLSDPMDFSPPGSSVHGVFQAEYWSGVPLLA